MTIIKLKFSHTPTNTHTPTIIHMIVKVYPVESKLQHQQQPFSKCKREYLTNFFVLSFVMHFIVFLLVSYANYVLSFFLLFNTHAHTNI